MDPHHEKYQEKIGYSRGSLWAPFHAVGMVARIQGDVPTGLVEAALRKLQILYPPLASRVRVEKDGAAWLTTEDVGACPLEVRAKASGDDWRKIFLEQERIPFAFDHGPIARFFLLRGHLCSDLIAIVPHLVCDGYAMTLVMSDAVALLNDPDRVVALPSPPAAITWQSVSHAASDNLLLRGFISVVNHFWLKSRASMRQDRYEELHRSYWERRQNGLLAFELSPAQTSDLAARCKQRGVMITGALVAAFLLAQGSVRPVALAPLCDVTVAVNIRNRMVQPPGRVMGVYASNISLTMRPKPGTCFWELARQGHTRIHNALNDRSRILWPLALGELDPSIADTQLAALSNGQLGRRLGPLARFVKIGGLNPNLDVSNIGRVELPEMGTPYGLETILPLPPLWPGGGLALNVLTVNGRMNVILKYRLDQLDEAAIIRIRDRAQSYLIGE